MIGLSFVLSGMLAAAMPFLLAALGELVAERAGVLNLGIEGMMALGAVTGFVIIFHGFGHATGFLGAGLAGAALSLLFAWLALSLRANQVAAGLAIGIFGQGLSALFGKSYESMTVAGLPKLQLPLLADLPVVGGMFTQDIVVWLGIAATLAIWAVLRMTKLGLIIRAVGENPTAARALGYPVIAVRYCAVMFGGLMAGLAGAYAATVYTPLWADGMIAGRGWIALALVVFGTWMVGRLFFGAILFGAVSLAQLAAQANGVNLNSQLLASLPYIVTIVVLGLISSNKKLLKRNGVASLGVPFDP
ncbi:ABC transporter permease [Paracoccus sp. JM45]|uniref:ABC transporter permease n=1 Tax=Paracoccus sp. JM45 TaxID=2283626 RepID=UPI000E6B5AF5|nr:ABC transporter permease [Paracoccus sp. JM45]RJE79141.1 ABC transporter permease [Paracoccus sp. JM45]